ncbi:hypothetical protein AMTRI_Chr13g116670 [Amborella trichopoda]
MALVTFHQKVFSPAWGKLFSSVSFRRSYYDKTLKMGHESKRVFQLKMDPLSGNIEWVVVSEAEEEEEPKSLLSSTSYLDMLNDSRRNRAFHEAIKKTITRPCHVLDIGAGTGLLSMMASKAMHELDKSEFSSTHGMVTACEAYLPMVKLMKKVLRANGMENQIRVIHKRSDELEVGVDIPLRANILVSEILDSELLGEGLIPTLQHAHDTLLTSNPQTVPYRATIYGQLVECAFLHKMHDLYSNEALASDDIHLVPTGLETAIYVKPQQYPFHCSALSKDIKALSEPYKIFTFDFWRRPDSYAENEVKIKVNCDGNVHAVISWWVLQLDSDGTIFYSTAPSWINSSCDNPEVLRGFPGASDWCDHWKQCVWFCPRMGMPVSKNEQVLIQAIHEKTSFRYNLRKISVPSKELGPCNFHIRDDSLVLSPERIAIYGDQDWRLSMLTTATKALQKKNSPLCVVADDSVFWTILTASLSTSSNVLSMLPGLHMKGSQYLHAVAKANGIDIDRVKVLGKRASSLTMDDTDQRKVDLLVAEPFYNGNEGSLPWQNLRFWKERTTLDPILSKDAVIMPCKGILKACAMFLPCIVAGLIIQDLWRSRRCLRSIEAFDHSVVNKTLGGCGDLPAPEEGPWLPFFIWQCGETEELAEVFTVMEFNFLEPIRKCSGQTKIQFNKNGICHGFALWIDWVMDSSNTIVISTGPARKYWKQGVKLLSKPVSVREYSWAEVEGHFDPSNGELMLKPTFSSP